MPTDQLRCVCFTAARGGPGIDAIAQMEALGVTVEPAHPGRETAQIIQADLVWIADARAALQASRFVGFALGVGVPACAPKEVSSAIPGMLTPVTDVGEMVDRLAQSRGVAPPSTNGLRTFQRWTADMITARGFEDETLEEALVLFLEEVGELVAAADTADSRFSSLFSQAVRLGAAARAARKGGGIATDATQRPPGKLADELVDLLVYVTVIALITGNDLASATTRKLALDAARRWTPAG